jgi:hypothetical protein
MKTILNRIAFALLIASLTSVLVFAKGKSETVNFPTDIKINGTLVKQGVYDLKFDEKTGELSIVKNGKVIARATTSSAKRDRKAKTLELKSTSNGADTQLVSIAFGGSDENHVLNGSQAAGNPDKSDAKP